jgi:hypothetical protein
VLNARSNQRQAPSENMEEGNGMKHSTAKISRLRTFQVARIRHWRMRWTHIGQPAMVISSTPTQPNLSPLNTFATRRRVVSNIFRPAYFLVAALAERCARPSALLRRVRWVRGGSLELSHSLSVGVKDQSKQGETLDCPNSQRWACTTAFRHPACKTLSLHRCVP